MTGIAAGMRSLIGVCMRMARIDEAEGRDSEGVVEPSSYGFAKLVGLR